MRLGGNAAYLCELTEHNELPQLVAWAAERKLPVMMIGDGSNIVWNDQGFAGLVIVNRLQRFETFEMDENTVYVTVGGGENWDSAVERCVAMGLNGVAELSLIPGTAGATPVQNVGAYGKEISDHLVTLEVFDTQEKRFVNMQAMDCAFGYRTSRFKTTDKNRFLITTITLMLNRNQPQGPYYDAVSTHLAEHGISAPTVQDIRDAVIAIRSAKLPNPQLVANNGSFFANPIIDQAKLSQLVADYPTIKYWRTQDDRVKISGAWLIETVGFKGVDDPETGMATWETQPLVLVNKHAKSTADLLRFKQKIIDAVQTKFCITLEQEPELI